MSTQTSLPTQPEQQDFDDTFYPESDGKPMADNTKQYNWIVTIKENLESLLPEDFIAADLFWSLVSTQIKIIH